MDDPIGQCTRRGVSLVLTFVAISVAGFCLVGEKSSRIEELTVVILFAIVDNAIMIPMLFVTLYVRRPAIWLLGALLVVLLLLTPITAMYSSGYEREEFATALTSIVVFTTVGLILARRIGYRLYRAKH